MSSRPSLSEHFTHHMTSMKSPLSTKMLFKMTIHIVVLSLVSEGTEARLCRSLPKIDASTWSRYDLEFGARFSSIHHSLSSSDISPVFAAEQFSTLLTQFLESKPDLVEEAKEFFAHNPEAHTDLESARKLKNLLKKKSKRTDATSEDKAKAKQALRHYSFLLKKHKENLEESETKKHEKAYKKNFFKYAKEITHGTFGQPSSSPTYTKAEADLFYSQKYTSPVHIDKSKLSWFPSVQPPANTYNLTPYRPRDIKEALLRKSPSSSPGEDQLLYGFLARSQPHITS